MTSDGGFDLEAVSGFGWRSWAGDTQPLAPVHCAKASSISPCDVKLPSTNPPPSMQHSPSLL